MKAGTVLLALGMLVTCLPAGADQAAEEKKLKADSQAAIEQFKRVDSSLRKRFDSAAGYAVFPNVGKGGFILGGAHGNGLVYEKGKLVGRASLTQVTVGAQVGGQEFSEIIFFETKEALAQFKESKLEMSAQVGAVAAAEGVSENAKYVDGVMVFTKAKTGLMAEASVGGQKFSFQPIK
jgi:lipid-binding SYLF domain-containing protein